MDDDEALVRRRSDEEIAVAWIDFNARLYALGADEDRLAEDGSLWASEAMMHLTFNDPLRALELCFLIARSTDNPDALVMLGAGPLEDLLSTDPTFIGAIALEASASPMLVRALKHMWQSTIPEEVWLKVKDLTGRDS